MTRRTMFIAVLTCAILGIGRPAMATPVQSYGQLKIVGNKLQSQDGKQIQLVGEALAWSQWFGQYWNAGCVKWLASDWKCTIVRASMGVDGSLGGYLSSPSQKTLLKTVVQACIDNGLYVIIDWHVEGNDPFQSNAVSFFQEMSQTYGSYPNVLYELWNEPHNDNSWSMIKSYCQAVLNAIRPNDPDNIVLIGTPSWCRDLGAVGSNKLSDPNVGYVFHFYAASDGSSMRSLIDQTAASLPLFCTEWSCSEGTGDGTLDFNSGSQFVTIMNKHRFSRKGFARQ